MGKFKDSTGREWQWPALTLRKVNHIRDQHKLNLRDLLSKNNEEAAVKISNDECLFAIFADLCRDQAGDLDQDALMDRWDGPTMQAAREALMEGFFTFSLGQAKGKKVMEAMRAE